MLQVCQAFNIANLNVKTMGEAKEDHVIEVHGSSASNSLLHTCQEVFTYANGDASDFSWY